MINSNYNNTRKQTKSAFSRLGYWQQVVINGKEMYVRDASMQYPRELFALVTAKKVLLAKRVYMNLLDCIRALDFESYKAHRLPYHQKVVSATTKKWHKELDFIVRNKLKKQEISAVQISVNGKVRTYHAIRKPVLNQPRNCSTTMCNKFIKRTNQFEFTKLYKTPANTLY
jgi:hypothetical protein